MASKTRPPRANLDPVAEIGQAAEEFTLFAALRLIEAQTPDRPRLGMFRARAALEPIRLGQHPSLSFPPVQIHSVDQEREYGPPRLNVYGPGLFGPQGPLPIHLTEFIIERQGQGQDDTFRRFTDIFQHRLLSLFYRAWAQAEPTVSYDRPDGDLFARQAASLIGLGSPALSNRDALSDESKLHYAGTLIRSGRGADGLESMVANLFGVPADLEEFRLGWLRLDPGEGWRLGQDDHSRLGTGAVLGEQVLDAQHRAGLVIGPLDLEHYHSFLPGGAGLAELQALVRLYTGDQVVIDLSLVLAAAEVPKFILGSGIRLGWTGWLGDAGQQPRRDFHLELDPCRPPLHSRPVDHDAAGPTIP